MPLSNKDIILKKEKKNYVVYFESYLSKESIGGSSLELLILARLYNAHLRLAPVQKPHYAQSNYQITCLAD